MPTKGGIPTAPRSRTYLIFILIFGLLSLFLFLSSTRTGDVLPPTSDIHIVLWDVKEGGKVGDSTFKEAVLRGQDSVHLKCPFNCTITTDRHHLHLADAVVFDPTAHHYDHWRRVPITLPHKQPYQQWVKFSYQHEHNYPLTSNYLYSSLMDLSMTYRQDSDIPLSLFCPWVDSLKKPESLLKTPFSAKREKSILFLSSNCHFSGASARTAYVEELMKHIKVDSYGKCLHNIDWIGTKNRPTLEGAEEIIELMKQYKIVLAFENGNVTDYVTEKILYAFEAGSLPVYMGAPNIDDWLPAAHSIVKTSSFESPKALADYLTELLEEEEQYLRYFEWKKKGKLSPTFLEKFDNCMVNSACNLCQGVADSLTEESSFLKRTLAPERPSHLWQSIKMGNKGDSVSVKHHKRLCVTDRYTFMAWIYPHSFGDQRIIDKNKAGQISGYNFDIQAGEQSKGFVRLCAGDGCWMSKKAIFKDTWTHVAVVYSSEHPSVFENHVDFYVNGEFDHSETVFAPTKQETWYALTFGRAANQKDANSFDGSLDNIAIFNRDLDGDDIRRYMFTVPVGDEPGLVGFWSFDDPTDEVYAHDVSIYGYDGTVDGAVRQPSLEKPLHLGRCQ